MERRTQLPHDVLREFAERINSYLNDGVVPELAGLVVGFCWPYKAEFDTRFAIRKVRELGARCALPVVVKKGHPLEFREWWPGAPMVPGVYDIPVPDGTARVELDAVFVPMNAFDGEGFRLGYGGGFFDRTLAAISPQPIAIGIAYSQFRLSSIRPNEHDRPMDLIVTEMGIHQRKNGTLQDIEPEQCRRALRELISERGFPRNQEVDAGAT